MTVTIKPGQIYLDPYIYDNNNGRVTLILDLNDNSRSYSALKFRSLEPVSYLEHKDVSEVDGDLVIGKDLESWRDIIAERLRDYHFDVGHFKQLWAELDRARRFEIGKVYKKTYNTIESFYLCIGIDEDQKPMFLDDKFGWSYCQVSDSIQEGLEPASVDETIATLTKLSAGLDDHILEIKNWREVISCSFQTLGVQVKLHPNSQVKYA